MRLAIVSLMAGQPWGGSEMLWSALAEYALSRGDQVMLSVYNWGTPHERIEKLMALGATIKYRKKFNPNAGLSEKVLRFISKRQPQLNQDYQSIIDFKPEAVFISQGDNFDLALHHFPLYELIKKNEIPYAFVCHNFAQYGSIPPMEIFESGLAVFQNAIAVYFVADRQREMTERKLLFRLSNAHFTWNPLSFPRPVEPYIFPTGDLVNFAVVSALTGGKGQDTILGVLREPQWKDRKWKINFYGSGDGENYLKKLVLFYGLSNNVQFHGHVSDVSAVWQANHILIIPSATEGLPISLVEAMACGRPTITTDVGGITELISERLNGFVAEAPSTISISKAMERAWEARKEWETMGRAAFDKINDVLVEVPEIKIYKTLITKAHTTIC